MLPPPFTHRTLLCDMLPALSSQASTETRGCWSRTGHPRTFRVFAAIDVQGVPVTKPRTWREETFVGLGKAGPDQKRTEGQKRGKTRTFKTIGNRFSFKGGLLTQPSWSFRVPSTCSECFLWPFIAVLPRRFILTRLMSRWVCGPFTHLAAQWQ